MENILFQKNGASAFGLWIGVIIFEIIPAILVFRWWQEGRQDNSYLGRAIFIEVLIMVAIIAASHALKSSKFRISENHLYHFMRHWGSPVEFTIPFEDISFYYFQWFLGQYKLCLKTKTGKDYHSGGTGHLELTTRKYDYAIGNLTKIEKGQIAKIFIDKQVPDSQTTSLAADRESVGLSRARWAIIFSFVLAVLLSVFLSILGRYYQSNVLRMAPGFCFGAWFAGMAIYALIKKKLPVPSPVSSWFGNFHVIKGSRAMGLAIFLLILAFFLVYIFVRFYSLLK